MKLARQIIFHTRLHEEAPAIAYSGGVASYGLLARHIAAAAEVIEAIAMMGDAPMVMLDIRNPLHHTALILALALSGIPSASVPSTFAVEKK